MGPSFKKLGERQIWEGHVVSVAVGDFEAPDGTRMERVAEDFELEWAKARLPSRTPGNSFYARRSNEAQ